MGRHAETFSNDSKDSESEKSLWYPFTDSLSISEKIEFETTIVVEWFVTRDRVSMCDTVKRFRRGLSVGGGSG